MEPFVIDCHTHTRDHTYIYTPYFCMFDSLYLVYTCYQSWPLTVALGKLLLDSVVCSLCTSSNSCLSFSPSLRPFTRSRRALYYPTLSIDFSLCFDWTCITHLYVMFIHSLVFSELLPFNFFQLFSTKRGVSPSQLLLLFPHLYGMASKHIHMEPSTIWYVPFQCTKS